MLTVKKEKKQRRKTKWNSLAPVHHINLDHLGTFGVLGSFVVPALSFVRFPFSTSMYEHQLLLLPYHDLKRNAGIFCSTWQRKPKRPYLMTENILQYTECL